MEHVYSMEPNGAPHTVPGDAGAQSALRSCRLGSPAAAAPAVLRCRAAGHRRGRRGAKGPQARSFPAPSPAARAFPAFPERKPAWTLELGESSSLIALPIVAWGRGHRHLETSPTFLSLCLLVPAKPSKICLF